MTHWFWSRLKASRSAEFPAGAARVWANADVAIRAMAPPRRSMRLRISFPKKVAAMAPRIRTVPRLFRWLNSVLALALRYIVAPRMELNSGLPHATDRRADPTSDLNRAHQFYNRCLRSRKPRPRPRRRRRPDRHCRR